MICHNMSPDVKSSKMITKSSGCVYVGMLRYKTDQTNKRFSEYPFFSAAGIVCVRGRHSAYC